MTYAAGIQMSSGPNVGANLIEAGRLIDRAVQAGARLIVLPENFASMPVKEIDRLEVAEQEGVGPIQDFLASKARQHRIWIVGGTLPLKVDRDSKTTASSLLFNDRGDRVARYDKIHLFDVQLENGEKYNESGYVQAGSQIVVADTPFGRLGMSICYDLRFPELYRGLLDQGAEILVVPSAFTEITGRAHWEVLVRARAIENLAYVVAPGQSGYHINGRETHGNSMIVSPWGIILDRLPRGSGFVIAELDRKRLEANRTSLPSIFHRQFR
ncbi:MAG: carbon-nitrogen hydrolase family protein [Gammaproteobacteria bacterium]|nr:carbon-nitrogen hydrolase family protein [Gammaproteobacteria bacterium]